MAKYTLKFCPLLTGPEDRKTYNVGQVEVTAVRMHECIKDQCAAYFDMTDYCQHFQCDVYTEAQEVEE